MLFCSDLKVKNLTEEQEFGHRALKESMLSPMRQIAKNCGVSSDLVIDSVRRQNKRKKTNTYGYNFVTGEVVDMFEAGVIDPARVTAMAIKNAVSVVSTLLTTATSLIQEVDSES